MSLQVHPTALGRYEIQSVIGQGTMGVVYKAVDPALDRTVALKTIHLVLGVNATEREVFEQRFLTEARLAAGLTHPNIVVVHDVGRDEATGTPFIALEYLEGQPLDEYGAAGETMEWREALRIAARLADALHLAHSQGIVHRDIKPANIMILPSGDPKIMDFGIAKAPTSQLTVKGDIFGTPSYMSPEQAAGVKLDGRSDLFSLGSVLYEQITGHRAFDAPSVPAILAKVTTEAPTPPTRLVPDLPADIDRFLARCLAKDPGRRYPDGASLKEDVESLLADQPVRERPGLAGKLEGQPGAGAVVQPPDTFSSADTRHIPGSSLLKASILTPTRVILAAVALFALVASAFYAGRSTPRALDPAPPTTTIAPDDGTGEPDPTTDPAAPGPAPGPGETPAGTGPAETTTTTPPTTRPRPPPRSRPRPAVAATPRPTPTPTQRPTPRPTQSPIPVPSAQLILDLEHKVKRGSWKILIDKEVVLEEPLMSEAEREAAGVDGKVSVRKILSVPSGEYFVRVEVVDNGRIKAGLLRGAFRVDQPTILEIRLRGSSLSLKWK